MIIYRTTGPWGAGKGADLSAPEADGNFYDLDQRVKALAENVPQPVSVHHTEMVGTTFTVHLTNGQVDGPFDIPFAQLTSRGSWGPGVEYNRLDYVSQGGVTYIVNKAHQSPPIFDPEYSVDGEYAYGVAIPAADPVYDVGFFVRGLIGGSSVPLFRWVATRPVAFKASITESRAIVGTAFVDAVVPPAALALVFRPADGGSEVEFGSITFNQADPTGFVEIHTTQVFNPDDVLEVRAPPIADSIAADLSVTLVASVSVGG